MRLYNVVIVVGMIGVMSMGPMMAWAQKGPALPKTNARKTEVRTAVYDLNGVHGALEGRSDYLCRIINGSLEAGDKNSALFVSQDGLRFSGSSFRIVPTGKSKAASLAILYGPGPFGVEIVSAVLETKISVKVPDTATLECKVIRRDDQALSKISIPSAIQDAIRKPVFRVEMVILHGQVARFILAR